jgi:hypothetical protein
VQNVGAKFLCKMLVQNFCAKCLCKIFVQNIGAKFCEKYLCKIFVQNTVGTDQFIREQFIDKKKLKLIFCTKFWTNILNKNFAPIFCTKILNKHFAQKFCTNILHKNFAPTSSVSRSGLGSCPKEQTCVFHNVGRVTYA